MANYVENVKVGSGESWPVRDADAHAIIETLQSALTDATEQLANIQQEVESLKATVPPHTHDYLPLSGGTLTGTLVLTEGVHYGDTLPEPGTLGRIFFKKVSS